MKQVCFVSQL